MLISGISPTTADRDEQVNASLIAHEMSFSFLMLRNNTWCGSIPNDFKAGGKILFVGLIQTIVAPFLKREESNAAINADEEVSSSWLKQKNSCKAENGKTLLGKASLMRPSFVSCVSTGSLKPSRRRICFLKSFNISCLSFILSYHALLQQYFIPGIFSIKYLMVNNQWKL
jgi:hypothetical protein